MILTKFEDLFRKYIKKGMLFNMQPCIILQFQQNYSFCTVPQLPHVFRCPNFTPFDYTGKRSNLVQLLPSLD